MILRFFKTIIIIIILSSELQANTKYFEDGLNLFNKKKFDEAKFKFEQDILFNPKVKCLTCIYQKFLKKRKKFRGTKP